MNIINVKNLTKLYENTKAVDNISFTVEKGKFYAFLGENGAGKSTTINILSTLLKKSSGEVVINENILDKDDKQIRKDIGIVFQQNMLDDFLTVHENLICKGKLYGLSKEKIAKRIQELSDDISIDEILDRKYGKLSGGQKRRADIARALMNKPEILILDEPTTGLDPYTRHSVWQCVFNLQKKSDITVFLTTHYMEEAANADRIIVIDKGHIIENDTPNNLKIKYSKDKVFVYPKDMEKLISYFENQNVQFDNTADRIEIDIQSTISALDIAYEIRSEILDFEVIKGNLDQVFMTLIESNKTGGKNE